MLCLTKESVITATLVHAPMCVYGVCVCVPGYLFIFCFHLNFTFCVIYFIIIIIILIKFLVIYIKFIKIKMINLLWKLAQIKYYIFYFKKISQHFITSNMLLC